MSIAAIVIGLLVILISYLLPERLAYSYRWLFGFGLLLMLAGIGTATTRVQQWKRIFPFSEAHYVYTGTITKIPTAKPTTIQLQILLDDYDRKVIAYIPQDSLARQIQAGQHITFFSKIEPFPQIGDIHNFNYNQYIYNQGYVGVTFISDDMWEISNQQSLSPIILAERCREQILHFYASLHLNQEEHDLLSALTLGYTTNLSEDVLNAFRTTGTAHILAVSGLHIGILYIILVWLLSPIKNHRIRQPLVLALLWIYIFIVGLPPSAIRAGVMLSLVGLANISSVRTYTLNSIFVAAFFILLIDPISLFDLSFQLSFMAVLSLCLFMPIFENLWEPRNKILRTIYNTLCISLVAQIGILPLSLYYFGSLPSYFLLANLLIVPLLSVIFYDILLFIFFTILEALLLSDTKWLSTIALSVFKLLANWILAVVRCVESLPYSNISNIHITLFTVAILFAIILFVRLYLAKASSISLMCIMTLCLLLLISSLHKKIENIDTLTIINNTKASEIRLQRGLVETQISPSQENKILWLKNKNLYILSQNNWHQKKASVNKLKINYLLLATVDIVSVSVLNELFEVEKIIFGNALPRKTVKRLEQECEKLRIPYYDLYTNGNLTINF